MGHYPHCSLFSINHYIYYLSSCIGGHEKGQSKAEETYFSKRNWAISNFFLYQIQGNRDFFFWKIVSCKIKVQIIGEKMTFTSRHLVDPWEILPVSLWYFYLSSLGDVFTGRFWAVGSGAFILFWGLVLLFIDWWLKLWS